MRIRQGRIDRYIRERRVERRGVKMEGGGRINDIKRKGKQSHIH